MRSACSAIATVVGYHDYSETLLVVQGSQNAQNVAPGAMIEVARRLVGEQHLGPGDQCPGDGDALHFAPRKFARLVFEPVAQADFLQEFDGPLVMGFARAEIFKHPLPDHPRREHVFQRRQLGEQVIELKDHAEPLVAQGVAPRAGQVVDSSAGKLDLAGVGLVERAEDVQERALARSALADDRKEFAAGALRRSTPCSTGISTRPLR